MRIIIPLSPPSFNRFDLITLFQQYIEEQGIQNMRFHQGESAYLCDIFHKWSNQFLGGRKYARMNLFKAKIFMVAGKEITFYIEKGGNS